MTTTTTTERPTMRHWVALLMVGLLMFMMATDFTAIFLATPPVAADLQPSSTQLLWMVHIGELVAAGTLITMGWLTGRIGPRTLLLVALILYGVGSAVAAFSPNAETLLTARVLIGAATAAASPAAFALLRLLFTSARDYSVAFAVVMGAFPVGTALGPPMTGLLLEHFWWGSVFLINVPVAAAALLGGIWLFPRTQEKTADRIDLISVVISTAAVMLAVFGLQEIADRGFTVTYVLCVVIGGLLGWWFIRRQRRIANPLLDLSLFASRVLRISLIFFLLGPGVFIATDFLLVQHLQIVLSVPAGTLGLVLAIPGAASIASTALTPALTARFAPVTVMTGGIGVGLLGVLILLAGLTVHSEVWVFAAGMAIAAVGYSPPMVLAAQLMLTSVTTLQTGPAASLQDISASLGSAIGVMVLGSTSMLIFGRSIESQAPADIPASEVESAAQSPGAAAAIAEQFDGGTGARLLEVVHDAWTAGTVTAYAAALVIAAILIILVWRGLRGVQLPNDDPDEADREVSAEADCPEIGCAEPDCAEEPHSAAW